MPLSYKTTPTAPTAVAFTPEGDMLRAVRLPGSEPAVVYLHGLGCHSASSWAEIAVARGRRSLLIDLPGHGRSDAPPGFEYSLPELADAVASFLEAQPGERYELAGHSLGGSVAIHLAAQRPDLVSSLILVEPALDPAPIRDGDIAAEPEEGLRHGGWQRILEREMPWRRADVKLTDPVALVRSARGLNGPPAHATSGLLLNSTIPALLVTGDSRTYRDDSRFGEHGVRTEKIPGAGHFVMNDRPDELLDILGTFGP